MCELGEEKKLQEKFEFERAKHFKTYNAILAYYQAKSCIEFSRGKKALDIPCGDGFVTKFFVDHFEKVVGVDASSTHLIEAKKRLPFIEFHEALIEELTLSEKFDSIFMLNILEHVIDPVNVLKKVASFLEEDGILIVHVPNAEAINRQISVKMGTLTSLGELSPWDLDVAGHRRYYTLDSLKQHIQEAGLKMSKTGGIFYKMLSTAQFDWFLENGLWEGNNFGWGRIGGEEKDWKAEFCRACYEFGKERPEDCNVIYAAATINE